MFYVMKNKTITVNEGVVGNDPRGGLSVQPTDPRTEALLGIWKAAKPSDEAVVGSATHRGSETELRGLLDSWLTWVHAWEGLARK